MLDPELLKILACPVCKTEVEYQREAQRILCRKCGRRYPVKDDIPIMLVEEAEHPPT
ncbi:MAG: Trm112 family protein [Elusimicrobia bacterium]|nr:Trm112 family protein [Elusimicrobiota bacterium]